MRADADGRDRSCRAASTRASPAARRSATRSCRCWCWSRSWRILDETDSGLDIDALKVVAHGINSLRSPGARHRAGHALPAPARSRRARPGARAGARPHPAAAATGAGAANWSSAATTGCWTRRPERGHPRHAWRASLQRLRQRAAPRPAARGAAQELQLAAGLPQPRDDLWRYADLRYLDTASLAPLRRRSRRAAGASRALLPARLPGFTRLVFANGRLRRRALRRLRRLTPRRRRRWCPTARRTSASAG